MYANRSGRPAAEHLTVSTNRLEAFSDGVLAVAITLLVLNISVPAPSKHHGLAYELAQNWPEYAAYMTSFITIGIIWMNHHAMIARLREADHAILFLNLLLLLSVGVLPFATSLMATYLRRGHADAHLAAAVYSGAFLVMSLIFSALNRHILLVKHDYLNEHISEDRRRAIFRRAITGIVPYVLATALAVVSAYITLAICAAVAAYYATPVASGSTSGT
ncbi:MAG: potassium channel family protein [Solirubrobacteraceae bacterium]|jgi:uncharacterized membrane protein|nr:potassium channel family protein [Solirubrobacteraceae bacterium]